MLLLKTWLAVESSIIHSPLIYIIYSYIREAISFSSILVQLKTTYLPYKR